MCASDLETLFADAREKETLGQLAQARELYSKIVGVDPGHTEGWHRLARVNFSEGNTREAIRCLQCALNTAPHNATLHNNLGNFYWSLGQNAEAISAYRQTNALAPGYTNARYNLGVALAGAAQFEEALTCFRSLIETDPFNHDFWYGLGDVLAATQQLIEAETSFQRALDIDDQQATTWFRLANTIRAQQRCADASLAYEEVLRRAPEHAQAHNNLGGCRLALGNNVGARQSFETAIAIDPLDATAWENLVRTRRFSDDDHALIQQMECLETSANLSASKRSAFGFAIGKAKVDLSEFGEAFAHYKKANEIQAQLTPFDADSHDVLVGKLIRAFSAEDFSKAYGTSSERPVFIVGMPRSGTTLVEQILASHSQVVGPDALITLSRIAGDCGRELARSGGYPAGVSAMSAEQAVRWANRYLGAIDAIDPHAPRITDKMPTNFLHLGLVALLLPGARIIHCCRDPRDTCLSNYFQPFTRGHHFSYSLESLVRYTSRTSV